MTIYSPEFKRSIIERVATTPGLTLLSLAHETGIARASLYRWMKHYAPSATGLERRMIKPSTWSTAQKLRALLETQSLRDDALGEYLRKNGLYYINLVEWKAEILDEVKKNKTANTIPASEATYLRKIRELESELKMKDKALKEATALLDLKKKAELIWPVVEEEKSPVNTEKLHSDSSKKQSKKAPE
jgi:transposase-like protein